MALFKMNRGNSNTLPTKLTDGYAYFCTDTAEFFIDYADSNGILYRKKLNAKDAETLTGMSLDQIKAYTDANSFKVKKVETLPVMGDKSTIYIQDSEEFVWVEKSNTPVPNDGSAINTIYFNTSLSSTEVDKIITEANLPWVTTDLFGIGKPLYIISLLNRANDLAGALFVVKHETGYTINTESAMFGTLYASNPGVWEGGITLESYPWNEYHMPNGVINFTDVTTIPPITGEAPEFAYIGKYNDKLSQIISLTPFINDDAIVPNDGTVVENIYLNTSLTIDETVSIMQKVDTWYPLNSMMSAYFIASDTTGQKGLAMFSMNGIYGIADFSVFNTGVGNIYFASQAVVDFGINQAGWQGIPYCAFNDTTVASALGMTAGTENDKLVNLFSITPNFGKEGEWEKLGRSSVQQVSELPQEGELNTLYVVENNGGYDQYIWEDVAKGAGVPVPNSGTEEYGEIYINGWATVDEVVSVLKKLTYIEVEDGIYVYHVYQPADPWSGSLEIQYSKADDSYVIYDIWKSAETVEKQAWFSSKPIVDGYSFFIPHHVGWHSSPAYGWGYENPVNEYQGEPVGMENDKLASIIATTPFEKPMFVPNGSVPVPNDGSYVEKIYFNTSITAEELFSRLQVIPTDNNYYRMPMYDVVSPGSYNKRLTLTVFPSLDGESLPTVLLLGKDDTDIYYSSIDMPEEGVTAGWQVDHIDWNDDTAGYTDNEDLYYGGANDLLVDIISITPNFATKQGIGGSFAKITPSLDGYATEEYVDNAISNIPGVDLSGYVKLSDLPALLDEYMQWGSFSDLIK